VISSQPPRLDSPTWESLDGSGAADHDQPYRFGRRPRSSATYPFSTRQFARLLVLRGRVQAGEFGADDVH
jgi:hypothetical protein